MAGTDYELLYESTLAAKQDLDEQHTLLGEEVKRLKAKLSAEREACAKICDRYATALDHGGNKYVRSRECQQAAAAIRARSNPTA